MDASSMGVQTKCRKLNDNHNMTRSRGLCDLPNVIIYHILSFLPMKDVVKTSILSKWWQYIWSSVPNLELCRMNFRERSVFMNFVERALILRDSPSIRAFTLRCDICDDASRISTWITAVARGSLVELRLDLGYNEEPSFVLPCCILGCTTLIKLELASFVIDRSPSVACLPNLKILSLRNVTFTDATSVEKLFSSPLLEELSIWQCSWKNLKTVIIAAPRLVKLSIDDSYEYSEDHVSYDRKIQIVAVSLKCFYYTGSLINRHCICGSTAQLVEAEISNCDVEREQEDQDDRNLLELLNALSSVKSLTIIGCFYEGIENRIEVLDTVTQFNRLTKLKYGPLTSTGCDALLLFLRRSPGLRSLELVHGLSPELDSKEFPEELLSAVPLSFRKQLKSIKIGEFLATPGDLSLVRFLLKTATALEEMVIRHGPRDIDKESLEEKLMMFPRGLNCRITILTVK